jgi:hemerythrin superfamily protein
MDITREILDDHAEQRKLFATLEEIGPGDRDALEAVWGRLSALLDAHAEAEEQLFYPELVKLGRREAGDEAEEQTEDAVHDHNEIRDAVQAVRDAELGSGAWFAALAKANEVNGDHMAEEEREGLTRFREHVSLDERHALAVRFVAFEARHLTGVRPVDKDPEEYVREHR